MGDFAKEVKTKRKIKPIIPVSVPVPVHLTSPVFGELLDYILRFIETSKLLEFRGVNRQWLRAATKELLKRKDHQITFTFCPESDFDSGSGFVKEVKQKSSNIKTSEIGNGIKTGRKNPKPLTLAYFNRLFFYQDGETPNDENYLFPCVRFSFKYGDLGCKESLEFFHHQQRGIKHLQLNLRPAWIQNGGLRRQSNVLTKKETLIFLLLQRLPSLESLDIDSFPLDGTTALENLTGISSSVVDSIFTMSPDQWRFQNSNFMYNKPETVAETGNDREREREKLPTASSGSPFPLLHTLELPSFNCDLNKMKMIAEMILFILPRAPRLYVISFGWFFSAKLLPIFIATGTVHLLRTPCFEIRIFEDSPALLKQISESESGSGSGSLDQVKTKVNTNTKWTWDWINNPIYLMKIHLETPPTPAQCAADSFNELKSSVATILRKSEESLYEINFYGAAFNFFIDLAHTAQLKWKGHHPNSNSNSNGHPALFHSFPLVHKVRVITTVTNASILEQLLPQSKSGFATLGTRSQIPVWIFYGLFPAIETFYFRPRREDLAMNLPMDPDMDMDLCFPISKSYGGVNKLVILNACEASVSRLTKAFSGFGYGPTNMLQSVEITCLNFPKVAPFLWKLRQLKSLKVVMTVNQDSESVKHHSFPELDAAFTGFSTEETLQLWRDLKVTEQSNSKLAPISKRLKLMDEPERISNQKSILDLPNLNSLHLEFYGKSKLTEKRLPDDFLLSQCPIAERFAFQPMKMRTGESKLQVTVTTRKMGETSSDLDSYCG